MNSKLFITNNSRIILLSVGNENFFFFFRPPPTETALEILAVDPVHNDSNFERSARNYTNFAQIFDASSVIMKSYA